MSADNWATCPKCVAAVTERRAKREKEIQESYGKVPAEKYVAALHEFSDSAQPDFEACESCLREDYDLGIHEGKFYVSYRARCSNCDFKYEYKHEEKI